MWSSSKLPSTPTLLWYRHVLCWCACAWSSSCSSRPGGIIICTEMWPRTSKVGEMQEAMREYTPCPIMMLGATRRTLNLAHEGGAAATFRAGPLGLFPYVLGRRAHHQAAREPIDFVKLEAR